MKHFLKNLKNSITNNKIIKIYNPILINVFIVFLGCCAIAFLGDMAWEYITNKNLTIEGNIDKDIINKYNSENTVTDKVSETLYIIWLAQHEDFKVINAQDSTSKDKGSITYILNENIYSYEFKYLYFSIYDGPEFKDGIRCKVNLTDKSGHVEYYTNSNKSTIKYEREF